MKAIEICRTEKMGGHVDRCVKCGHEKPSYNSCRNRHCPKCQGALAARWVAKREAELLPVPYFHIVFTVSDFLEAVIIRNQRITYEIFFRAASDTLLSVSEDERHLNARPGFIAMLHTWGQTLYSHTHIHCVVPAGGISTDGKRWVKGDAKFLLPVKVLSNVFRGKFLDDFKKARAEGKIEFSGSIAALSDESAWKRFIDKLYSVDWVVYAKKPFGSPQIVLKYLSRYTHKTAISNHRLERCENGRVTFRYRDYRDGKSKLMTLDAMEFIRRFLQHVLPDGFVRMRYYGFMANRNRSANIELCRKLIGASRYHEPNCVGVATAESEKRVICPKCGGQMINVREIIGVYRIRRRGRAP